MKYRYLVGLAALLVGVHATCLADGETFAETVTNSAEMANLAVDLTVKVVGQLKAYRQLTSTNDLLPFAYNNDKGWQREGVSGETAKIRFQLSVLSKEGPYQAGTNLVCGTEGTVPVVPDVIDRKSYVRADLYDRTGAVIETAYFDLMACEPLPAWEATVVASSGVCRAAFDTRTTPLVRVTVTDGSEQFTPWRELASFDEVLPLAYDNDLWPNEHDDGTWPTNEIPRTFADVGDLTKIEIRLLDGTEVETIAIPEEPAGTTNWTQTVGTNYLVTLYGTREGAETNLLQVVIDLSGVQDLPIVLTGLPDDANALTNLTIDVIWLKRYASVISREDVANTNKVVGNGLPAWKNFVFGLDPDPTNTNALNLAFTNIVRTADESYVMSIAVRSGENVIDFSPRRDWADFKYRLISTNELVSAFLKQDETYGEEKDSATFEVNEDGAQRFYRARLLFYWK